MQRCFEETASLKASWKMSSSVIVMEELSNEMLSDGFSSKFNYIETQTDLTKQEAYLTEIINNNNKRICKLEQEIDELTRRLQDTQWQNDALNKRLFTFLNLESKDSNVAFYSRFQTWDAFMAVFKYLDPGERGQNISVWRSYTDITSNYSKDQTDELKMKKGRARSCLK